MYCLEVKNLHKKYENVHAVKGVSFNIKSGICLGLLGPNGAGKSTIMEILEDIQSPTEGEILFYGHPRGLDYRERIGIQFQSTALQDYMYVQEALKTFSSFYKKPYSSEAIIKTCRLEDLLHRDHRYLSGGQRKRLLLGLSLINNPELIFLDEPTTGLDPVSRREFWQLVEFIKKQGRTVILSTHYMDEASSLCDEIIIINQGKIFDQGPPKSLLLKYFEGTKILFPLCYKKNLITQLSHEYVEKDGHIEFKTKNIKLFMQELVSKNISINDMEVRPYTLDDLFVHLTGQSLKNNYVEYLK